jgi:pantothenate kinase
MTPNQQRQKRRQIIAVVGPPGSGKSTLARRMCSAPGHVNVPMDGFHYSNRLLGELGRAGRKGAMDTFDSAGFATMVERLVVEDEVVAPAFDHVADEPIAASIRVGTEHTTVVIEGNWLLGPGEHWELARSFYDEVIVLDEPDEALRPRLVARQLSKGRTEMEAAAWADEVDLPNARLVRHHIRANP